MSDPDDYLMMSGIQHFCFCRRQWALIHVEQQWAENLRTTEGKLEHKRCHDETQRERRGDLLITRGMKVISHRLKLSGVCDVVEFRADPDGVSLQYTDGLWSPMPVEYKHGHSKASDADRVQLCAQAMALEEMLACEIPEGALYYEETRRREVVLLTEELRRLTQSIAEEMNQYFERGYTPRVKTGKFCNACSLKEICLPVLCRSADPEEYIREHIDETNIEGIG
jgi:CRISPR-associated exonuclease Cas4